MISLLIPFLNETKFNKAKQIQSYDETQLHFSNPKYLTLKNFTDHRISKTNLKISDETLLKYQRSIEIPPRETPKCVNIINIPVTAEVVNIIFTL